MDTSILMLIISTIIAALAYLIKAVLSRLNALEKELMTKTTEQEVRVILSDKIDPMKETISEIKEKLDKVIDLLLKNK